MQGKPHMVVSSNLFQYLWKLPTILNLWTNYNYSNHINIAFHPDSEAKLRMDKTHTHTISFSSITCNSNWPTSLCSFSRSFVSDDISDFWPSNCFCSFWFSCFSTLDSSRSLHHKINWRFLQWSGLEVNREYYQNCSVLDCVTQCSQSAAHLYKQFLQVQQIGFVSLEPLRHA